MYKNDTVELVTEERVEVKVTKTLYNNPKDYWYYGKKNMIMYCIDGVRDQKYASAHYLIEKHGLTRDEAHQYLNNLRHQ